MNEKELLHKMKKKKNYAEYLPEYTHHFCELYHDYASIQLAFSYYTVYELLSEDTDQTEWKISAAEEVTHCLQLSGEEAINALVSYRRKVTDLMNNITLYTDILSVFEHILNRVEFRFKENEAPNIDYVATRIQQFIFADKDAVVTNDKIKTIVAELPLRMTKQRFYDIIGDSLDIYIGSDQSAVEGFIYMLRTIATLHGDLKPIDGISGLDKFISQLYETDYAAISEETYQELAAQLDSYGQQLTEIVNLYMQVQECINHAYTILLCMPYVKQMSHTGTIALDMVQHIRNHFEDTDSQLVLDGCNTYLEQLEGKQEDIMERVMGFEALLHDVASSAEKDGAIQALLTCEKLVSSSIFIELTEEMDSKEADAAYINKEKEKLLQEFAGFFKTHAQIINRSVMSIVLGAVPVFFQNTDEIIEYINYTLSHCSDVSELCASVHLINEIME